MKKILFLLLLFSFIGLTSCTKDEPEQISIFTGYDTDKLNIKLYKEESTVEFDFISPYDWTATVVDPDGTKTSETDWLTLDATSGESGDAKINITASLNSTNTERNLDILLCSGSETLTIKVLQTNTSAIFIDYDSEKLDLKFSAKNSTSEFEFTSRRSWTAAIVDTDGAELSENTWLTIDPKSGEEGVAKITISADSNLAGMERNLNVIISSGDHTLTVKVLQGYESRSRAIIVSEGQFMYGTGSLTTLSNDKIVTQNIFRTKNNRPLGDVPQSLAHIGDNYYIPVNNSMKVEVIDATTFESVETMVLNEDVIPMYVEHLGGGEIIVSDQSSPSKLLILDINHNKDRDIIKRVVTVPSATFQMKIVGEKIFIAGGDLYVFDLNNIYEDHRRSVLNMDGNRVGVARFSKLCLDKNGLLWAITDSGVVCIDPNTEKVIKNISISGGAWGHLDIDKSGENLYIAIGLSVYTVNVDNPVEPNAPIIEHDNNKSWVTYTMGISKENTIFMTRVLFGSITRGRVFEYNLDGTIANKHLDSYGAEQDYFRAGIFPHYIHFL